MSFQRRFFRRTLAKPEARELLLTSLMVGEADRAVDLDRDQTRIQNAMPTPADQPATRGRRRPVMVTAGEAT